MMGESKSDMTLEEINDFIKSLDCGSSFWIDPDGGQHTTDVGYGMEFWGQIYAYLTGKPDPEENDDDWGDDIWN